MSGLLRAVDVANAALMEVGARADACERPDPNVPGRMGLAVANTTYGFRAAVLARMAEFGPEAMMRCRMCGATPWLTQPCMTAAHALRQETCTGTQFAPPASCTAADVGASAGPATPIAGPAQPLTHAQNRGI